MTKSTSDSAGPGIVLCIVAASLVACAWLINVSPQPDGLAEAITENERLAAENTRLRRLLVEGTEFATPAPRSRVVPVVDGLVLNTKQTRSSKLVEISVGSDDGLRNNDVLFVYLTGRNESVGRIKLVLVTPDRAVGTVTEPPERGQIQQGDSVATRL